VLEFDLRKHLVLELDLRKHLVLELDLKKHLFTPIVVIRLSHPSLLHEQQERIKQLGMMNIHYK
jgi:hypothetical protein